MAFLTQFDSGGAQNLSRNLSHEHVAHKAWHPFSHEVDDPSDFPCIPSRRQLHLPSLRRRLLRNLKSRRHTDAQSGMHFLSVWFVVSTASAIAGSGLGSTFTHVAPPSPPGT